MAMSSAVKVPEKSLNSPRGYTLGADPEFFVYEGTNLIPAFLFLPEKKKTAPLFWDGFQAEFTMDTATMCLAVHGCDVRTGFQRLKAAMNKHLSKDAKIVLANVVRIPDSMLEEAHDPHVALGCAPSMNAYKMAGKKVLNPRQLKYRFAGGHMHFGGWTNHFNQHVKFIKALDKVVGVWAVGAAQKHDIALRREYYGLAGEFRPTRYNTLTTGFEYRTLSNFYFCHPAIHQLTWQIARQAVVLADTNYIDLWATTDDETINCINNCDADLAKKILRRNSPLLRWALEGSGWDKKYIDVAQSVGMNGINEIIGKPDDIERNWRVTTREYNEYSMFKNNLGFLPYVDGM